MDTWISKHDGGIAKRAVRRWRSYYTFRRRLTRDMNEHFRDRECACYVPGKGQARFKDTPTGNHRRERLRGEERPARERRILQPELATTRSPWPSPHRTANVRHYPRTVSCLRCGAMVTVMTTPPPKTDWRLEHPWDPVALMWHTRHGICAHCEAKEQKRRELALARAA